MAECDVAGESGFNDDAGLLEHRFLGPPASDEARVGLGESADCQALSGGPCFRLHYRLAPLEEAAGSGAPTPVADPGGPLGAVLLPTLVAALLAGIVAAHRLANRP